MTWAKICGTTNFEDAKTAVDAGADALGFIFYEKSPRNISANAAREIVAKLPGGIENVGVFVEGTGTPQEWFKTAAFAGLSSLQIHIGFTGESTSPLISEITGLNMPSRNKLYLALPASILISKANESSILRELGTFASSEDQRIFEGVFLDSGTAQKPGGTGKVFDWQRTAPAVADLSKSARVVVSGGLSSDNVGEAIRILKPWGVDVVSGVEAAPGKKDPRKVRDFVKAVREAQQNL